MTTTDNTKPLVDTDASSPASAPAKKASAKKTTARKPSTAETSVPTTNTSTAEPTSKKTAAKTVAKAAPKTVKKPTANKATTAKATDAATPKKSTNTDKKTTAPKPVTTLISPTSDPVSTLGVTDALANSIEPSPLNTPSMNNSAPLLTEPTEVKQSKTTKLLGKSAAKKAHSASALSAIKGKMLVYAQLMRIDRPIGILLLLWPTLWSLWLAAKGVPSLKNLVIFSLGVVIMRSAGCVINDIADRNIDGKVKRTQNRPLATGAATYREAVILFISLCVAAFGLVLLTDPLTIKLSIGGLLLACCYPFMKRHTHLPQVVLGAAFAWSIPMAFAAEAGELSEKLWLIYVAVVLWTVTYDTFYAMVDRDDDIKIGVKSTAILFGEQDRVMTGILQAMTIYALFMVGDRFELGSYYYAGLVIAAGLFAYQQWLIRFRERTACFNAFLNNNWVGLVVFVAIAADLALR